MLCSAQQLRHKDKDRGVDDADPRRVVEMPLGSGRVGTGVKLGWGQGL